MGTLWHEIRHALRRLIKNPTSTLTAVITLALGIGVATGAYSIIDGLAFRGVEFEDADHLVALQRTHLSGPWRTSSVPEHDFATWCVQQQSFEALAAYRTASINLRNTAAGEPKMPKRYNGAWVSPVFLDLLRVDPLIGRGFTPGDAHEGAEPVVLIGYEVWLQDFGGTTDVTGRTIRVNGQPATVIGVLPQEFLFPVNQEVWLPLALAGQELPRGKDQHLKVIGRLKEGVPLGRAANEMSTIADRLGEVYPETNEGMGVRTRSYTDHVVSSYLGDDGWLMLIASFGLPAFFVLLIACVNVTNLLTGRAAARSYELAIRSALGSGRLRNISQVLTEAGLLSLAGSAFGTLLAIFAVRSFNLTMTAVEELPYWVKFEINTRVLFAAVLIGVFSALLSGILPAVRASSTDINTKLHDGARGTKGVRLGWLSNSLAVFALALSCALAVAAALSVRSTVAAQSHELSFDTKNILTARLGLVDGVYPDSEKLLLLYAQIRERVASRPEVVSTAIATAVPTDTQLGNDKAWYKRPDEVYEGWWEMPVANSAVVSPGYFAAFGVDLLTGRDFSEADRDGAPLVVIVNEEFARKEWPDRNPVGQRVQLYMGREEESADPNAGWAEVIGLAPNLQFSDFNNENDQHGIYLPLAQHPRRSTLVIVRTRTDPAAFTNMLRRTVQETDADLPIFFVRTMDQVLGATLTYHRIISATFVVFGAMALLLAAVGLYGVTSVTVMQRIPEMGVRMALGAHRMDVLQLVLKQGSKKTAIGVGAGLLMGWGLGKALQSFLFQVGPADSVTFTTIPLFLIAVSLLAYLVPAWRASQVDPVEVLRSE